MPQEEITGTEISEFPEASTIYGGDVVAGVQSGSNKKFSFATILAWIESKLSAAGISYDPETSGSSAENVQDALNDAFSGIGNKQSTITASGILKGDGQGNISAAVAGTDYGTYSKPSGGIPSSDMASAVQTSLDKADTAYQKPSGGIPASDIASGVIPSQPSDIGAQEEITASGILKGDGQGGVSAATPGTDYQAPLTAGTDYATPAQLADKANQSQLAYVETGTTASRNYTAGQYISLSGLLYTADTAIASGATFYTSGGNKNLTECVGGGFNDVQSFNVSPASGVTINSQSNYKIGNLVFLYSEFKITSNLAAWSPVYTLPFPAFFGAFYLAESGAMPVSQVLYSSNNYTISKGRNALPAGTYLVSVMGCITS